jgi:quercetin dioxygenase-like cupin family protein
MPKRVAAKVRDEQIFKVDHPYEDARGRIDYFIMPQPVHWVGVMTSKKGSVRANHWHPRQQQKCLILSGRCISVYKDLTKANSKTKHHLAGPGDLVVTPPRVAHAVIYLEDTVFLNLVSGARHPAKFGTHTKPYQLVKPEEIPEYASQYGVSVKSRPRTKGSKSSRAQRGRVKAQ